MKEIKLFINGDFVAGSNNETFTSIDSATGEKIAICSLPSTKDIDNAVSAARDALKGEWASYSKEKRSDILLSISEKLKERKRELIELEIKDSGSTLRKAKADIHNASSFFKVMSKACKNFNFTEEDERASREGFSKNFRSYKPIGVCAQIIPWNFPLVMAAWKIGPVIASGSTCVLKSAMETPITASILAEIISECDVPPGVINIITGGAKEGSYLSSHKGVDKVAFTGSTNVGAEILKNTAQTIKTTTLELGGKSPNIILNDADLDIAVDGSLYAFLYHQGQACDSGTRLLIDEKIYPQFMEKFLKRIEKISIGLPHLPETGFGPIINEKQFNTIMGYIEKTKSENGTKLLCGGERITEGDFSKGYYIRPTAFEITPDNTIFHEEIFGPVVGITKFKSEKEAIELANNSNFGLAGAVWSKDTDRARNIADQIEAGTVWINEYHLLNPGMPFGGFKQSGLGREMGVEGLKAYLEVQHLWISDCDKRDQKMWFDAIF